MDVSLTDLWLPILVSSVVIFFASFLAWVVLPHHKKDWIKLDKEDAFLSALQAQNAAPGQYMFPHCGGDHNNPEFQKKWNEGPIGILSIWDGGPNMAGNMIKIFIFYLVVGVFVGYIGTFSLAKGADYMDVFRLVSTATIAAYCLGLIPHAIWFKKSGRSVMMDLLDGIVYSLLTAGIFGWLWPGLPEAVSVLGT